jgi:pimeloyl-[acyl-carrier protein] methyl ester esterase
MSFQFILIRGLVREAAHWGEFRDHLQKAFPNSPIDCLDIPGAGRHYTEKSPTHVREMVELMRQDFLKIAKPLPKVLIAVSLGGMISAQWLKVYSEDFQFCILMNTSYADYSALWERLRPQALKNLLKALKHKGFKREHAILQVVSNDKTHYDKNAEFWFSIATQRPVSLSNTLRQLVAAARFSIKDFKPAIPTLILASTQDRMVSVECSRKIAKKWETLLIEHPSAGHDITLDAPEWVVDQITRWPALGSA